MQTFKIKPVGDFMITDPESRQPLPKEGAVVAQSNYWRRRIADGEVEVVVETKKASKS